MTPIRFIIASQGEYYRARLASGEYLFTADPNQAATFRTADAAAWAMVRLANHAGRQARVTTNP